MAHQFCFYVPPPVTGSQFILEGDEAVHAARVLRLHRNDSLLAVDGEGTRYYGRIVDIQGTAVRVSIERRWTDPCEQRVRLTLVSAVPRGARSDWLVEKATEIGVSAIVPLVTAHSTPVKTVRISRWKRVALTAMKQSGRAYCPRILEPMTFETALRFSRQAQAFIAQPHSGSDDPARIRRLPDSVSELVLYVGPGGGFSENEIAMARERSIQPLSLGTFRLRTETAALVGAHLLLSSASDLSGER